MIRKFTREISSSQSQFKAQIERKYVTQQCSYNLPIELEDHLRALGAIAKANPNEPETNAKYFLANGYSLILGANIIAAIGESYKKVDNHVVFTHTEGANGTSKKIQLKKTDFKSLSKNEYNWFVTLYEKNLESTLIVVFVDDEAKTVTIDLELTPYFFNGTPMPEDEEIDIDEDDNVTLESESGDVVALRGLVDKDLALNELVDILRNMYNNPEATGKSMTPHIFGLKYGEVIDKNDYSIEEIAQQAGLTDSYAKEIRKGLNIYRAIKNNEYDLSFCRDNRELPIKLFTSNKPRNRIVFGAPGTGKSFTLNKEKDALIANGGSFERVTFHPDYSYANFVGTYKPVPVNDEITYSFVAGPFIRTWIEAIKSAQSDDPKPYVLLIEEINRANVAAVFGDVFQLLDRDENGVSEYPIQTSKELREYLARELKCWPDEVATIRIPSNMFIWATMNSADQGVFPMDTAFKRRWDFKYIGIDESQDGIKGYTLEIAGQKINWNALRTAINVRLTSLNINEDKLIGPYFINEKTLKNNDDFIEAFKSKVIMYLFEDAAKQRRGKVFYQEGVRYSDLCQKFMSEGVKVFNPEICKNLIDTKEA